MVPLEERDGRDEPLVPVLETIDPAHAIVIGSLLDAAGIPYLTRGEDAYDAFRGAFRGTVFGSRGRPIVFLVHADRAEEAAALLETEAPREPEG